MFLIIHHLFMFPHFAPVDSYGSLSYTHAPSSAWATQVEGGKGGGCVYSTPRPVPYYLSGLGVPLHPVAPPPPHCLATRSPIYT